jgi:hypothetical protein
MNIIVSLCIASMLIAASSQSPIGGFKKIEHANDKVNIFLNN